MIIPVFYRIWVTDPELIQSMKGSSLPEAEALELHHKYTQNKKKYCKRIIIYALIFLIGAGTVLLGEDSLPNEAYVYIPLLIAIFVGVIGGIFSANKYGVSSEYVKALQKGYPKLI